MPYYKRSNNINLDSLIETLAKELQTEPSLLTKEGPVITADAPTIIEEPGLLGRLNVTVVWDAWKDLSGEQRGHVIMEAYKKAKGHLMFAQIGLAMGLTREQRDRILSGLRQAG